MTEMRIDGIFNQMIRNKKRNQKITENKKCVDDEDY